MRSPDLLSSYEYKGHVDVEWYDTPTIDDIPDLPWNQIYAIGNLNGQVPVVIYETAPYNLPGGGIEQGESLEQALAREIEEELNMKLVTWQPLGYQICTNRDTGKVSYQFRAYAQLEKIGEFVNDPGGSVKGHKLIDLHSVNDHISYGVVGERLIRNARKHFEND